MLKTLPTEARGRPRAALDLPVFVTPFRCLGLLSPGTALRGPHSREGQEPKQRGPAHRARKEEACPRLAASAAMRKHLANISLFDQELFWKHVLLYAKTGHCYRWYFDDRCLFL